MPRFITKKWIKVHDHSGSAEDRYKPSKKIRLKTSLLRSDLCDFSDAYTVAKGTTTVKTDNYEHKRNKSLALKNSAPFISCISKINNVLINNAEDLDIVMPMCNLIDFSKNYSKTSGSLLNYYRDELTNDTNDNNFNKNVVNSKSFKCRQDKYYREYLQC